MPNAVYAQPTISQLYAAFSPTSHQVFQQAMASSRGGVVRVEDLLAALVAQDSETGRSMLGGGWRLPTRALAKDENYVVPLANEPALRELLRTAFLIAHAQPDGEAPAITPNVLWASTLLSRRICYGASLPEMFRRLQLRCPSWLSTSTPAATPRTTPTPAPTAQQVEQLFDERSLVDVILERWLAIQARPAGPDRETEMARIRELTTLLESRPLHGSGTGG